MRRADKEIKDTGIIQSIMDDAAVCRLGMAEDNVPYIVPMNFGYKDNTLYFHCAAEGRKLDIISRNPEVCFEVDTRVEICSDDKACSWGARYYSIIGEGRASVIEDADSKRKALDVIMRKYSGRGGWEYSEEALGKIRVIRVEVKQLTAKGSGWSLCNNGI